jgi:hypothetical protein
MALDNGVLRCENVESLQEVINALLASRFALFKRRRGDAGAVHDFINGQSAILSALGFLSAMPDLTDQASTEIIQTVWRRYRLGPTLGTGQACQYLLNCLYEKFSDDSRLEWPGWERFDW